MKASAPSGNENSVQTTRTTILIPPKIIGQIISVGNENPMPGGGCSEKE